MRKLSLSKMHIKVTQGILRWSQRHERPAIPNNYLVYLQEDGFDIGDKENPLTFFTSHWK